MATLTAKTILKNATKKHGLSFIYLSGRKAGEGTLKDLEALIDYARFIGYGEGFKDGMKTKIERRKKL